MTRELINVIKVHDWTKFELEEIMDFCSKAIEDCDCITDEVDDER